MICQNKSDFLGSLSAELSKYNISGQQDILTDFEQHFAEGASAGETEAQVCEKLGDPAEIAKQYAAEAEFSDEPPRAAQKEEPAADASGFDSGAQPAGTGSLPLPVQMPQKQGFSPRSGDIAAVILLDLLVFSWAIPSLASLILSFYTVTAGFAVGGLGVTIGGIVLNFVDVSSWFVTCFSPVSTVLLGMFMASASVLLVLLGIKMTIGFINIILRIINWHGRVFAGRNICSLIGKKYRREGALA